INALDPLQDKVVYCRQIQQRGTGHATKTAAGILQAMQFNGHVLVTAGDKIIDPQILIKLIQLPHDLSFLVGSIDHFPGSGRVVYDNNSPVDIFEFFDIQKLTVIGEMSHMLKSGPLPADQAKNLIHRYIKQSAKAAAALGDLYENVIKGQPVTSEMLARIPAGDIHKSEKYSLNRLRALKHANLSVYLFRASALYKSLTLLSSHNAQQEEYLPDVVSILAENGYHISTLEIDSPEQVMSFNTQEELKAIQEHYS
ncbi:hypothetical protein JW935_08425, partial [candidate division KSB1 bacterium]|nr:hypothetical protein [candidate division KSB1 bacterium]